MKLRYGFLFLACLALVATGCGSDSKDSKKSSPKKQSKVERAAAKDHDVKVSAVDRAKKDFRKKKNDVGACRNLAMSYIALASPASSPDPKKPAPLPKDRDASLKQAVRTLEDCRDIDAKDRDVQQMLASSYMATNKYDKAAKLLAELAKSATGQERANAFYAWGLAASNAADPTSAISAWKQFVALAPAKDPRVPQVKQSINALQAQVAAAKAAKQ